MAIVSRKVMPWLPRLYQRLAREDFRNHGITIWALRRDVDDVMTGRPLKAMVLPKNSDGKVTTY